MTSDDLAPMGDEEAFPCPQCGGRGTVPCGGVLVRCFPCGGSGYGPPPPDVDRLRAHCMARLAKWAERNLPPAEERED